MQRNPFDQFDAAPLDPTQDARTRQAENEAAASELDPALQQARIQQARAASASSVASAAASDEVTRGKKIQNDEALAERQEAQAQQAGEAQERVYRVTEGLTNILALRDLINRKDLASGSIVGQEDFIKGDAYLGASSLFNQDVNDAFAMQQSIVGDLIRRSRASGDQAVTGKEADTPREAERIAAAISSTSLTQSRGAINSQLDRAFDFYARRLGDAVSEVRSAGGQVPDVSDIWQARGMEMPTSIGVILEGGGGEPPSGGEPGGRGPLRFSPGQGADTQLAQGDRYSTPEDLAVANAVQGVYNKGGSLRDMIEASESFGRPVDMARAQTFARAIDYRDGTGEYEGQNTGFSTVTPAQSGTRSFMGQAYGDFARSGVGSSVVGLGVGAGNAATFGGLDELSGLADSLATGRDLGLAVDYANLSKQGAADAAPVSYTLGELGAGFGLGGGAALAAPKAASLLAGSGLRALGTGAAVGGVTGALESNNDRLGGALAGGALGGAGGLVGQKLIGPGVEALASSQTMQRASNFLRDRLGRPGGSESLPQLSQAEIALARTLPDTDVMANLREARELGLPYSLADAAPELRNLAGSVSRQSQDARALAERTFEPRNMDQAARARDAVNENLAPILDDPASRASDLTRAGSVAAEPFYQEAYALPAPKSASLTAMLNTKTGRQALKDARDIAENEGRNPDELGFVINERGDVVLPEGGGKSPTVETLDYVKRGIDRQVDEALEKNPITGAPVSGQSAMATSLQNFRSRFVDELDRLAPSYAAARAEAQPFIRARNALSSGQAAVAPRAKARDVGAALENMTDMELENYRSGFATGLGDLIDNQSLAGNPYSRIYGSTTAQNKIGTLYPDGSDRFARIAGFERDMARTSQEALGGSPTAARSAADARFANNALRVVADGATDAVATGGTLTAGNMGRLTANALRDRARLGFGRSAEKQADRLAPMLFDTTGDLDYLAAIDNYNRTRAARRAGARRYGGLFGASAPVAFIPSE